MCVVPTTSLIITEMSTMESMMNQVKDIVINSVIIEFPQTGKEQVGIDSQDHQEQECPPNLQVHNIVELKLLVGWKVTILALLAQQLMLKFASMDIGVVSVIDLKISK